MTQIGQVRHYPVPVAYPSLAIVKVLDVGAATNMAVRASNLIASVWQSIHFLAHLLASHRTLALNLIDGVVITHRNEDNWWVHQRHPPPHHQVLPSKCKCCVVKKICYITFYHFSSYHNKIYWLKTKQKKFLPKCALHLS